MKFSSKVHFSSLVEMTFALFQRSRWSYLGVFSKTQKSRRYLRRRIKEVKWLMWCCTITMKVPAFLFMMWCYTLFVMLYKVLQLVSHATFFFLVWQKSDHADFCRKELHLCQYSSIIELYLWLLIKSMNFLGKIFESGLPLTSS